MLVKGQLTNSYQVRLNVDGFEYLVDQPTEQGGENSGTTPSGMLTASVTSCKTMVAKGYLDHHDISFDRLEVETESELKGSTSNTTIDMTVNLKVVGAELNEKQQKFLTRTVETGCKMANILTAGGENTVTTNISFK